MGTRRSWLILLAVLAFAPASFLNAQTNEELTDEELTQADQEEAGQNEQSVGNAESGDAGAQEADTGELPDIDSQPIQPAATQGPGRFIPSEQISQDFGVSSPVDI